jgi:hypothetical protein
MTDVNTLYCTLAELRAQIDKQGTTKAPDTDPALNLIVRAASRAIDKYCNREPGWFIADTEASARYYSGTGKAYQYIDENIDVSAVAVKDSATDDEDSYTDWTVGVWGTTTDADVFPATGDPKYPNMNTTPYTLLLIGLSGNYSQFPSGRFTSLRGFRPEVNFNYGVPTVKVTAKWGYAEAAPWNITQAALIQSARMYKRGEGTWADAIANPETGILRFAQALDPDVRVMLDQMRSPSLGWTGGG